MPILLRRTVNHLAWITLSGLLAISCGGGNDNNPVAPSTAAAIIISSDSVTLAPTGTTQLTATPESASGTPITGRTIAWASNSPNIASVNDNGIVTAVATGTAIITATIDAQTARCTVTVKPLPRQLQIIPPASDMNGGDSLQLTAQYSTYGVVQTLPALAWSSSAPGDVKVDQTGHLVSDVSSGTVTITATLDSLTALATITIRPVVKPIPSVTYTRDADDNVTQPYSSVRTEYIDGTANVRVTPVDQMIGGWAPSPDGKSIVVMYSRTRFNGGAPYGKTGAFIVNLATRKEVALVPIMDTPQWSPDGKRIAYSVASSGTESDLYVVNADGSGVLQLTNQPGLESQPTWTPDSRSIAYMHSVVGGSVDPSSIGLSVVNADGSGNRLIPTSKAPENVAWSLDGKRVAFDDGIDVWVMNSDGTQQIKITAACPDGNACADPYFRNPSWSPDGQKLAYSTYSALVIANSDGSSPTRVNLRQFNGAKRWSPDGSRILFGAIQAEDPYWPSLFIVDRAGTNLQQISHGENVFSGYWLPTK